MTDDDYRVHVRTDRLPAVWRRRLRHLVLQHRREHGLPVLHQYEELKLDHLRDRQVHRQQDIDDRPSKRLPSRMQHACDRWSLAASQIAVGLTNATVDLPPQRPDRAGVAPSGVSNPTMAVVMGTFDHIERAVVKFVHLATPCALDGQHEHGKLIDQPCPGPHAVDLGDHAGVHLDADDRADNLLGATAGTGGWVKAVHKLASWHTVTASHMKGHFTTAYRSQETSALDAWVGDVETLVRQLDRLAGELAQWSGRAERRCATCGGGAADGRTECGRCRTAAWRQRTRTA